MSDTPIKMRVRETVILRVIGKGFVPFILLFALYVQFHGDYGPGGGFQAGVIFAAGLILHATVPAPTGTDYDADWWVGWCDHGALAKVCDGIKVMSYTESGPGTDPGPAAPDWFWSAVYARIRAVVPEPYWSRVFCGARAFGHLWDRADINSAEYVTYHQAIAGALTYGKRIDLDSTEGGWGTPAVACWFGTPMTVDRSQKEAAAHGFGGIGLWKLDDGDLEEFFPTHKQLGTDTMTAFIEQRFPPEYSWGAEGGPRFKTAVAQSDGGHESRAQAWQYPLATYTLTRDLFSPADHERMMAFWRLRGGRAVGFRWKDWQDYSGTAQALGTADGVVTNFALVKRYSYDDPDTGVSAAVLRPITKPVPGTVRVYLDGVEQASGWSVNTATGLVSFLSPPAAGKIVTADYEFDVPVRFADDDLRVVVEKSYGTYSWSGVGVEEIRV